MVPSTHQQVWQRTWDETVDIAAHLKNEGKGIEQEEIE